MKNQFGAILLLLVCLVCAALGIALISGKKQAAEQKEADTQRILTLSNQWVDTDAKLTEQKNVASLLEKDLDVQKKANSDLTNNFTQVASSLTKAEATIKATEEEMRQREQKIADLESQNQVLDRQALDLSASLTNLTVQITSTEKKLAASEGDKAFLEKELKRLIAEKAELERQFNDLAVLRAQVSKLKEELSIARRLEWIRQGLFANNEQKGAQRLMQGFGAVAAPKTATTKPSYDLNVEVTSDGKVQVIPPLTNSPVATPNPPQ
jgi:chromosome segregation ATPase